MEMEAVKNKADIIAVHGHDDVIGLAERIDRTLRVTDKLDSDLYAVRLSDV